MRQVAGLAAAIAAVIICVAPASAGITDHATFDASNPANTAPGAICFARRPPGETTAAERPWKFYASVANRTAAVKTFQVKNKGGGVVFYDVPANSSMQIEYAAGNNTSSRAFRLDTDANSGLAGYVSAEGLRNTPVFCTSCDNDDSGDAFCDNIIAD